MEFPASVPYPAELRKSVEKAVISWRAFCALPEAVRSQFPYNHATGMGVGYELKKISGANLDLKEDFHFSLGSQRWIMDTANSLGNTEITNFATNANNLISLMEPLIIQFAQRLEKECGLENFKQDIAAEKNNWFLRFLHYFGNRQEGDEIATAHADKSGFTLHLYESDPGLQYLDLEKQWQEMPVSSDKTVIIPGMRLQYRSHNELKALYHRVVATETTARQGRFSVVCFIHPAHTPQYNKQKAGRLQEFEPGFNYEMTFEEFAKLFI